MKYGLVLAGGGVRGACQAGVWKALTETGVEISAIAGASIGAVNGAIFAQGDFDKALEMWENVSMDDIVATARRADNKNLFDIKNLSDIARRIYEKDGLDMSPLENLLNEIIDEDKLRNSPIDFGAAAFSLTKKKEIYRFKDEIPRGGIVNYIMASACMPGFMPRVFGEDKLIDGGVSDNMPVGMLLRKDIDNIITVDVKGAGVYRGFNTAGKNIIHVRCDEAQTGLMEFDKDGIKRSIAEGYIRCMKAFGRYEGDIYAFVSDDYRSARGRYSADIISGIEAAARAFGIDDTKLYSVDNLSRLIVEEYMKRERECHEDEGANIMEKLRHLDSGNVVTRLVKMIESGAAGDFLTDKLSILGANYDAACAVAYFKN